MGFVPRDPETEADQIVRLFHTKDQETFCIMQADTLAKEVFEGQQSDEELVQASGS